MENRAFVESIEFQIVIRLLYLSKPVSTYSLAHSVFRFRSCLSHRARVPAAVPELSDVVIEHPRQLSDGPEMFDPDTF